MTSPVRTRMRGKEDHSDEFIGAGATEQDVADAKAGRDVILEALKR